MSFKIHGDEHDDSKCTRRDDESICSTTSSVFSTSSRLGKIPSAVKSSVRHLFSRDSTIRIKRSLFRKPEGSKQVEVIEEDKKTITTTATTTNTPTLHQLAHKEMSDLFLFKGLITTTLTTLHTRLTLECDRALASVLSEVNHENRQFPREQLSSIVLELFKMSEMVRWEDEEILKREVKNDIQTLERQIQEEIQDETTVVTVVKEIVNHIKQVMNQCICQYYKVAEHAMVIPCKGYRIEGKNDYSLIVSQTSPIIRSDQVEHMDRDAYWYRNYFMGNTDACHFFGYQEEDPLLISATVEYVDNKKQYRIIYRTKENPDQRKVIADTFLLNAPPSTCDTLNDIPNTTWKTIMETIFDTPFHLLKKMSNEMMISSGLDQGLLKLDEYCLHERYKFGVLLVKEGQTKEEEWFANQHDSPAFEHFLDIIGHRVELRGYTGWSAGLDRKGRDTWHG
ncbi:hypothetical protein G6F56_009030 [Rhizopus delemar]|nr:hypothetical protein G6F56_009030 [Rhizopus delemar]